MVREAVAADPDGVLVLAGAAVFFGELREDDRRRVLVDPASQFFDARIIRHDSSLRVDRDRLPRRGAAASGVHNRQADDVLPGGAVSVLDDTLRRRGRRRAISEVPDVLDDRATAAKACGAE